MSPNFRSFGIEVPNSPKDLGTGIPNSYLYNHAQQKKKTKKKGVTKYCMRGGSSTTNGKDAVRNPQM